jgi:alpha-methylacyl-CoA racemase
LSNIFPLSGIKILDLTRLLPGPLCTLHLADLGAEVIKIEDSFGDYARYVPPMQNKNSAFFLAVNRNKKSLILNLKTEEGKNKFLELAKTADVIVESFRPGVMEKLGLSYNKISKVNTKIIYCSITGFGQTGPWASKAGHDLNFMALSGVLYNKSNKRPQIPSFQIGDIVGGSLTAALCILASIIQRAKTGKGDYIDISILDGLIAHSVTALANSRSIELSGMDTTDLLTGELHCYNIYETSDNRHVALAALEYKFWEKFCLAINREDLFSEHMSIGNQGKKTKAELELIFKSKTFNEWVQFFEETDCCLTPVLGINEAVISGHSKTRNLLIESQHSTDGKVLQFRFPGKFNNLNISNYTPAPNIIPN